MNWISNVVRPRIRNYFARRDTPENLWIKCPDTGQLVFYKDVEANQFVIPGSNYHMRMGAMARLKSMFDNETWFDIAVPAVPLDRPFKEIREHWLDHLEREYVRGLLARHSANVSAVAQDAGLTRTYIYRLIQKHRL